MELLEAREESQNYKIQNRILEKHNENVQQKVDVQFDEIEKLKVKITNLERINSDYELYKTKYTEDLGTINDIKSKLSKYEIIENQLNAKIKDVFMI